MDHDLIKSLFWRARDQYESAIRWTLIVVLVCIAFHFITFRQFLRVEKELATVEADISRLSATHDNVRGLDQAEVLYQSL